MSGLQEKLLPEVRERDTPLSLLLTLGIALLLIFGSGLYSMEKHFATQSKSLSELEETAVPMKNITQVDAALNNKLIYAQGPAKTNDNLIDDRFGINVKGLGLVYNVYFYQDVDTGEGFEVDWISNPDMYLNPQDYDINAHIFDELTGKTVYVKDATLGAYTIDPTLLQGLHDATPMELRITPAQLEALHEAMYAAGKKALYIPDSIEMYDKAKKDMKNPRMLAKIVDNEIYLGYDPKDPQLGDMRITFSVIPEQDVSVIALPEGNTLMPYKDSSNLSIPLIVGRKTSMSATIQEYLDKNTDNMWTLRILFTMFIMFGTRVLVAYRRRTALEVGQETHLSTVNPWIPSFTLGLIIAIVIAFTGHLMA